MTDFFTGKDIYIETLKSKHNLSGFVSYEKDLVEFLKEDALRDINNKVSMTYLFFDKKNNNLLGYVTLVNDSFSLDTNLSKKFRKLGIFYRTIGAVKIGRLCVDSRYIRKRIGSLIINFVIKLVNILSRDVGCRFLILDSKRNIDKSKDAFYFYKKKNFEILTNSELGKNKKTTFMYYDLLRD